MSFPLLRSCLLILVLSTAVGCANIVPPGGGKKDVTPPKLRAITPADSQLNTRVNRIEMYFDEFVTVSDVSKELHISPALTIAPTMTGTNKKVVVKIPDSLLQDNTTYRISFGNAIKDLHEGNVYSSRSYTFSTGGWFDSLQLKGVVYDAASGLPDTAAATRILLYDAILADDIVVKQKPAYVTTSDRSGHFLFQGLPNKAFKIFALKEKNENLQFDGDDELIAFYDEPVQPKKDTSIIRLDIFKELIDSLHKKNNDSSAQAGMNSRNAKFGDPANNTPQLDNKHFTYLAMIDTSDRKKRTVGITSPITVFFSRKVKELNAQRISLRVDSADIDVESGFNASMDTSMKKMSLKVNWKENTLYTLRLLKSFAKDSAGVDALPSKYVFRTKQEEDYGKMEIHLPARYKSKEYLLNVVHDDADSVYLLPISDTIVVLTHLDAGLYKINIIHDTNGDGKWTAGDLKRRKHPETVIPYSTTIMMKPGWEHQIDFDKK